MFVRMNSKNICSENKHLLLRNTIFFTNKLFPKTCFAVVLVIILFYFSNTRFRSTRHPNCHTSGYLYLPLDHNYRSCKHSEHVGAADVFPRPRTHPRSEGRGGGMDHYTVFFEPDMCVSDLCGLVLLLSFCSFRHDFVLLIWAVLCSGM